MSSQIKNMVILVYQYSVVVRGIENKLKGMGYNVEVLTENFDRVENRIMDTALFLTYLPDDIMESEKKRNDLAKIARTVMRGKRNMILFGERKFYSELMAAVPEIDVFTWVNRPIDMENFSQLVDKLAGSNLIVSAKKRILIVDDDMSYAKMVREWIKDEYRVDMVTAGMQAISFLLKVKKEEQVDLILLDYEMPIVDGPQVLQMLRQEPATANIPVIFLTGVGTKEAVARVMSLRPDGYVLKSTTREDLLVYLHRQLQQLRNDSMQDVSLR